MKNLTLFSLITVGLSSAHAATIIAGDVTTALGPDFFIDAASTGGGDTNGTSSVSFNRNLGTLEVGAAGTTVSITGFGFASAGNQIAASSFSMTITYLGADGAFGGNDDVVFGTVTDSVTGTATGTEYVWVFDSPLTQNIDGANSVFRFDLSSTGGNFRFKTTTGTNYAQAKFSVAGTSLSAIPEPSTALLGALGLLALLRRRR